MSWRKVQVEWERRDSSPGEEAGSWGWTNERAYFVRLAGLSTDVVFLGVLHPAMGVMQRSFVIAFRFLVSSCQGMTVR